MTRNIKWKNKLIVSDITGSMYPYIGQVLLWYQLNYTNERKTKLAFFNDGDQKTESEKKIGNTGGVYYCEKCTYNELKDKMVEAMTGGYGGNSPENDFEAIIKSSGMMKGFDELILIADNNSSISDFSLIDQIKIPVRVVVCGAQGSNRISTEYLQLAYDTKGSVHTIEEDIEYLEKLKEGGILKIGKRKYQLKNEKFIVKSNN